MTRVRRFSRLAAWGLGAWGLAAALAASVVAFYTSARSLQLGPPLEVIAFTSVAANLIAIGGGVLVFHDSIGKGALQITGRMLAAVYDARDAARGHEAVIVSHQLPIWITRLAC